MFMAIYGVVLASHDGDGATPVYELNNELWVEQAQLNNGDSATPRYLVLCGSLNDLDHAMRHPDFIAVASSASDGIWGPMNPDFVRDILEETARR
jgi:hypothetical protein